MVHGYSILEMAGGFAMPIRLDESFHWLLQLYNAGLEHLERKEDGSGSHGT
jgi:hypothetical protein